MKKIEIYFDNDLATKEMILKRLATYRFYEFAYIIISFIVLPIFMTAGGIQMANVGSDEFHRIINYAVAIGAGMFMVFFVVSSLYFLKMGLHFVDILQAQETMPVFKVKLFLILTTIFFIINNVLE